MDKVRWTIRSVEADVIREVQRLHLLSGSSLGQIVSRALQHGLPAVRSELLRRQTAGHGYLKFLAKLV